MYICQTAYWAKLKHIYHLVFVKEKGVKGYYFKDLYLI